ncbi:MAG: hypothetical protein ABJN42_03620 [Roseibium sp.]|uniref:hypothetical protein n=1 Tax=Roseibium sp. TaxID=1936156 RepID=UPI0032989B6C
MIKTRRPIGFLDFFQNTTTTFQKCKTPEHEPDFVSGSYSSYWDMGHGVIRASDHWAGRNGCTGQASCVWDIIGEDIAPGAWATGYAAYESFRYRTRMPVLHEVTGDDLRDARMLSAAGGAVSLADWTDARANSDIPPWAGRFFPGPNMIPDPAKRLFCRQPQLRAAVSCVPARIDRIMAGDSEILIGYSRS